MYAQSIALSYFKESIGLYFPTLYNCNQRPSKNFHSYYSNLWDKVFKSRLKKFKSCLPQDLLSPLLNTLSHMVKELLLVWSKKHGIILKVQLKNAA